MVMKKSTIIIVIIAVGLLAVGALLGGQTASPEGDEPIDDNVDNVTPDPPQSTQEPNRIGVSFSPKHYNTSDFVAFFPKAEEAGGVLTWAGDWDQVGGNGTTTYTISMLSEPYELETIMIATYFHQDSGELVRLLDNDTRQKYLEKAVQYLSIFKPDYFGLGIEINAFWMENPVGYQEFAEYFNSIYPVLKNASEDTKIFTVFQLERMKGLHGGLFGGENSDSLSQWELLDDFQIADAYAFTTYPCLIHKDPADIPGDYFTEILNHTLKELLITEIGWIRVGPEGWESDEHEQAEFIHRFFELTEPLNVSKCIWSFLYDQETQYPFSKMGLLDVNEENTAPWDAWLSEIGEK